MMAMFDDAVGWACPHGYDTEGDIQSTGSVTRRLHGGFRQLSPNGKTIPSNTFKWTALINYCTTLASSGEIREYMVIISSLTANLQIQTTGPVIVVSTLILGVSTLFLGVSTLL